MNYERTINRTKKAKRYDETIKRAKDMLNYKEIRCENKKSNNTNRK